MEQLGEPLSKSGLNVFKDKSFNNQTYARRHYHVIYFSGDSFAGFTMIGSRNDPTYWAAFVNIPKEWDFPIYFNSVMDDDLPLTAILIPY